MLRALGVLHRRLVGGGHGVVLYVASPDGSVRRLGSMESGETLLVYRVEQPLDSRPVTSLAIG